MSGRLQSENSSGVCVTRAEGVLGLYNVLFTDGRELRDLTTNQTCAVLRDAGFDPARIYIRDDH